MTDTLTIRSAVPADLDAIAGLHARARATYYAGHLPEEGYGGSAELDRQRAGVERAIASDAYIVLCAVDGRGGLVGFAVLSEDKLLHFHVDPGIWRTGVGSRLHAACLPYWSADVRLEVFAPNLRARAFYARQGWIDAGVSGDHVVMKLAGAGVVR